MHLTNLLIFTFRLWLQILNVQRLTQQSLMLFIPCMMGNFYIYLLSIKVITHEKIKCCLTLDFDWYSLSCWVDGNIVAVLDVIHIVHAAITTVSCLWTLFEIILMISCLVMFIFLTISFLVVFIFLIFDYLDAEFYLISRSEISSGIYLNNKPHWSLFGPIFLVHE